MIIYDMGIWTNMWVNKSHIFSNSEIPPTFYPSEEVVLNLFIFSVVISTYKENEDREN